MTFVLSFIGIRCRHVDIAKVQIFSLNDCIFPTQRREDLAFDDNVDI